MPIEIVDGPLSERLEKEDYWCRELCTIYPYGLNDNVKGVGNISRVINETVVYTRTEENSEHREITN